MPSAIDILVSDISQTPNDDYNDKADFSDEWEPLRGRHGQDGEGNAMGRRIMSMSEDSLKNALKPLVSSLSNVINTLGDVDGMRLKNITVGVEISAEGGFVLIGSGKLGSKSAISMTFDVPQPDNDRKV